MKSMRDTIALFTIVLLVSSLGNLSQTAVNTMFPAISADLGVSYGLSQLLTTAYMLALGISVFAVSPLVSRVSMRTASLVPIVLMIVGSALDWLAPGFALLLIGRILQAISAGMTLTLMQTIAMVDFPPGRKATAMGFGGIAMGFMPNIGPTVGGTLVDTVGWRFFFLLMLIIIVVLAIAWFFLVKREAAPKTPEKFDTASFTQVSLAFTGILLGVSNLTNNAINSPFIWVPLIAGGILLAWFLHRQGHVENPLVNLTIFSSRHYVRGLIGLSLLFSSFMSVTLVVPLYWEELCGGTAAQAGMILLPGTLAALVLNPLAGLLADKVGARRVIIAGGTLLIAGAIPMAFLNASTPLGWVMLFQGIRQCGVSTLVSPLTTYCLATLDHRFTSMGSAFNTAIRQAAASFITGIMVYIATAGVIADATLAFQVAFALSALLSIALLILAIAQVRD